MERQDETLILHLAAFRWKARVTAAEVADLTTALVEMAANIPELRSYVASDNLHLRPGGADYGVAAVVEAAADLDAYLDHPLHKAVYDRFLAGMLLERTAVQLSVDEAVLRPVQP